MRGYKTIWINNDSKGSTYKIELAKNQKVVQVHRIKNSINFKANEKAMETLSANAFVLYMYLLRHSNDRIWSMSSKDIFNKTPLTEKTYPKAVDELISTGYLVAGELGIGNGETYKENAFHLLEDPDMKFEPPAK